MWKVYYKFPEDNLNEEETYRLKSSAQARYFDLLAESEDLGFKELKSLTNRGGQTTYFDKSEVGYYKE